MCRKKTVLFTLIMLIWTTSYGQFDKLKGIWISSANDAMEINDTINKYVYCALSTSEYCNSNLKPHLIGDTLSFRQGFYLRGELLYSKYDLVIIEQTDSTLLVKPSSKLSKQFFKNRQSIQFIKQEYNVDKTISFEKIKYHTTTCYGSCPKISLEIDAEQNIYINGEFYKDNMGMFIDSIKSGQFTGILTDSLYNELIDILKTCNLKTLNFPEVDGADAPVTTLIIYYNGQRKYLKSMFPPPIAKQLIDFLRSIHEKTVLTRTDEKRIIEK